MRRLDYPLYAKGVEAYLALDASRLRELLYSESLSQPEKRLLRARASMMEGALAPAESLLLEASTWPCAFLRAERDLLLATLASRGGRFEEAISRNLQALTAYQLCDDRRGVFLTHYNISVDFQRLSLYVVSEWHLQKASEVADESSERALILRAEACALQKQGRDAEALARIRGALSREADFRPSDLRALRIVASDLFVRNGDFAQALKMLEKLGLGRRDPERIRFVFEKAVLKSLLSQQPLGAPLPLLGGSLEYSLKWRFLRALQQGESAQLSPLWQQLQRLQPQVYGDGFRAVQRSDQNSLFFRCVSESLSATPENADSHSEPSASPSQRVGLLVDILKRSPAPMRKEELIEAIWNCRYEPAFDARFYKLMERAKRLSGFRIRAVNRAYRLLSS